MGTSESFPEDMVKTGESNNNIYRCGNDFLHQENLVFTYHAFLLLFVLFCKEVEKVIPCTCQSTYQAHHASRLFAQVEKVEKVQKV